MRLTRLAAALAIALTLAAPASAADTPKKPTKDDPFPGYKKKTIEGFTVIVNDDVFDSAGNKYERGPLDVLTLELKAVNRLLPDRAAKAMQRSLWVWAEWEQTLSQPNGRKGFFDVIYAGGHQAGELSLDEQPRKARAITILRTKALVEEHQPKGDSGRCALLHEVAHAAHDQLYRGDDPRIRAAHAQAVDRKLYDRTALAAADHYEFFAEMTCCYLDRLPYYPYTADDLKKHDPVTYKLMESIYGKPPPHLPDDPRAVKPKFDLTHPLDKWELGEAVAGAEWKPEELKGKPVLLQLWDYRTTDSLAGVARFNDWDDDLGVFGLRSALAQATEAGAAEVKETALARDVRATVAGSVKPPEAVLPKHLPHCVLFDHEGKCVYRGDPFAADAVVRETVGRAVLASAGSNDWTPEVKPLADALAKGEPPQSLIVKLAGLTRSKNAETVDQARTLIRAVTAGATRQLEDAELLAGGDPLRAFLLAEPLPGKFKDSLVGVKAAEVLAKLKKDKIVSSELKARNALENVRKVEAYLDRQPGSAEPKSPKFQKDQAQVLASLGQSVAQMKKVWPAAKATDSALKTADRFGVILPK